MACETSKRVKAGSSGNTEPQGRGGRGTKYLRGAGRICGFADMSSVFVACFVCVVGVISSRAAVVDAACVGTLESNKGFCYRAERGDVGGRIRQGAGKVGDRATRGRAGCVPAVACAASETTWSVWRGLANVGEMCVEFTPRVEACILAAADRSRRLLLTRPTGSFVSVNSGARGRTAYAF